MIVISTEYQITDAERGVRIRYEPHKHRTLGWKAAYHAVVARIGRRKSKSIGMAIDYKSSDTEFRQLYGENMHHLFKRVEKMLSPHMDCVFVVQSDLRCDWEPG